MDNECQLVTNTIKQHLEPQQSLHPQHKQPPQQQQHLKQQDGTFTQRDDNDNQSTTISSSQPKVTVSLPKHVASRLLDLVQKRDIALLKLGIISVQFEDDQIIPLTLNQNNNNSATTTTTSSNLLQQSPNQLQQKQSFVEPADPIMDANIENCNADECIPSLNTTLTALNGLANSPSGPILEGDELDDLDSNIDNASNSASILNHIKYVYFDNLTNYFDDETNNTTKYN